MNNIDIKHFLQYNPTWFPNSENSLDIKHSLCTVDQSCFLPQVSDGCACPNAMESGNIKINVDKMDTGGEF